MGRFGLCWFGLFSAGIAAASGVDTRPNVILILTDDQSNLLDSISHMPKLKNFIIDEGVTVNPSFVTTPVCCPARAALYTGKYIHNIGVYNNSAGSGGCSSLQWQAGPEQLNIAHYMKENGYITSFAGKYMNNYGYGTNNTNDALPQCLNESFAYNVSRMRSMCAQRIQHVPNGWDNWQALRGNSVYYNYTLSNNGVAEKHGDDYHSDYLIDLVKNRSINFIEENLNDATSTTAKPLFMVMSMPAAHEPADPAPQYVNYAQGLQAPRTPNFNLVMNDDARHWMVANVNGVLGGEAMNDTVISFVDYLYRRRLSVLQSVDDAIEELVETLTALPARGQVNNALEETFIVYTADNGYHLGQFAIGLDKRQPYETDVKVPFFARGPGIIPASIINEGAFISIDLAPTFLQMAQVSLDAISLLGFDGSPMLNYLTQVTPPSSRQFLIEYFGESVDYCVQYLSHDMPNRGFNKMDDGVNCGLRGPNSYVTLPHWEGNETWSSIQDTTNNTYTCLRSIGTSSSNETISASDTQYCTWISGEIEYFDLISDPWQLSNLVDTIRGTKLENDMVHKLNRLKVCEGRERCEIEV